MNLKKTIKKLLIFTLSLIILIFPIIIKPVYAFGGSADWSEGRYFIETNETIDILIQDRTLTNITYEVAGDTMNVYRYEVTTNSNVRLDYGVLYFNDFVYEVAFYGWGVSSASLSNASTFGQKSFLSIIDSDDANNIGMNILQYSFSGLTPAHSIYRFYLYIIGDYQDFEMHALPYLKFHNGHIYTFLVQQDYGTFGDTYFEAGYREGHKDGKHIKDEAISEAWQLGFDKGVISQDDLKLSLVSFVPKILGSMFNIFYILSTYRIPLINVSLLEVILILSFVGVTIFIIRILRGG